MIERICRRCKHFIKFNERYDYDIIGPDSLKSYICEKCQEL